MSYTVGVKRRYWFGFKKFRVKGHDWKDFRFLLNLDNGEQVQVPGFRCPAFKVYADFWIHHAQMRDQVRSNQAIVNTVEFRGVQEPSPVKQAPNVPRETISTRPAELATNPVELDQVPIPRSAISEEARRNAASRVRSILQSEEFSAPSGTGPN